MKYPKSATLSKDPKKQPTRTAFSVHIKWNINVHFYEIGSIDTFGTLKKNEKPKTQWPFLHKVHLFIMKPVHLFTSSCMWPVS